LFELSHEEKFGMKSTCNFFVLQLFVVVVLLFFCFSSSQLNEKSPIIGILTEPAFSGECITFMDHSSYYSEGSCFWSIYVDWIQQGGARVAYIPYDASKEKLDHLFKSLNGILFTGGELNLNFSLQYVQTAKYLYDLVLDANQRGDYFPLWGTCQGFQLLSVITAGNLSVLSINAYDTNNITLPLILAEGAQNSRMFGNQTIPSKILNILTSGNSTTNLHHNGVPPEMFVNNQNLSSFYQVLSTNVAPNGKSFVSTIEGKDVPVYAVQWHPERPQFDWSNIAANRSAEVVSAMQYAADFFVQEARKNHHSFPSQQAEDNALIYSISPVYVGNSILIYFFAPE